jgi:hypothetical protein
MLMGERVKAINPPPPLKMSSYNRMLGFQRKGNRYKDDDDVQINY